MLKRKFVSPLLNRSPEERAAKRVKRGEDTQVATAAMDVQDSQVATDVTAATVAQIATDAQVATDAQDVVMEDKPVEEKSDDEELEEE